jgi:hypothetical protein
MEVQNVFDLTMSSQQSLEERQNASFENIEDCLTRVRAIAKDYSQNGGVINVCEYEDIETFYAFVDASLGELVILLRELAVVSRSLGKQIDRNNHNKSNKSAPPGLVSLRQLCLVNSALVLITHWGIAPHVLSGINIAAYKSKGGQQQSTKVEKFISQNKPFFKLSDAFVENGKSLLFHRIKSSKSLDKPAVERGKQHLCLWRIVDTVWFLANQGSFVALLQDHVPLLLAGVFKLAAGKTPVADAKALLKNCVTSKIDHTSGVAPSVLSDPPSSLSLQIEPLSLASIAYGIMSLLSIQTNRSFGQHICEKMLNKILVGKHMQGVEIIAKQFLGTLNVPYSNQYEENSAENGANVANGEINTYAEGEIASLEDFSPLLHVVRVFTTYPTASLKTRFPAFKFYSSIFKQLKSMHEKLVRGKYRTSTGVVLCGEVCKAVCEQDAKGPRDTNKHTSCSSHFLFILFPCLYYAGMKKNGIEGVSDMGDATVFNEAEIELELLRMNVFLQTLPPSKAAILKIRELFLLGIFRLYTFSKSTKSGTTSILRTALEQLLSHSEHNKAAFDLVDLIQIHGTFQHSAESAQDDHSAFQMQLCRGETGCISMKTTKSGNGSVQGTMASPVNYSTEFCDTIFELVQSKKVQETKLPNYFFCLLLRISGGFDSVDTKIKRDTVLWNDANAIVMNEIEKELYDLNDISIKPKPQSNQCTAFDQMSEILCGTHAKDIIVFNLLIKICESMGSGSFLRDKGRVADSIVTILERFVKTLLPSSEIFDKDHELGSLNLETSFARTQIGLARDPFSAEQGLNSGANHTGTFEIQSGLHESISMESTANICFSILELLLQDAADYGWNSKVENKSIAKFPPELRKTLNDLEAILETLSLYPSIEISDKAIALRVLLLLSRIERHQRKISESGLGSLDAALEDTLEASNDEQTIKIYQGAFSQLQHEDVAMRAYALQRINRFMANSLPKNPLKAVIVPVLVRHLLELLREDESYVYLAAVQALSTAASISPPIVFPILLRTFELNKKTDISSSGPCLNLNDRCKVGEVLAAAARRCGDTLPHYAPSLIDAFSYPSSARAHMQDYMFDCIDPAVNAKAKSSDIPFSAQWSAFRASCLSNLADIILVLGKHATKYCSKVSQLALGIIVHESETVGDSNESVLLVRRGAVYLLRSIAVVCKNTPQPILPKEQFLSMTSLLEQLAFEDTDPVTKYHCGIAIDDLSDVVFAKDNIVQSSPFLIQASPSRSKPLIEVTHESGSLNAVRGIFQETL